MIRFSVAQVEGITQQYSYLLSQCGHSPTPQALAEALTALCPGTDGQAHLSYCRRLQEGIDAAQAICDELPSTPRSDWAGELLNRFTGSMSAQQRQGFYLQCFESFRFNNAAHGLEQANQIPTPHLATLPQEELQQVVLQQLQGLAGSLADESALVLSHYNGDATIRPSSTTNLLLLAAAIYASGLNGDLPQSFEQCPALLGACLAVESHWVGQIDFAACDEHAVAHAVFMLLCTLLAMAAAFAGGLLGGAAAESIFMALSTGVLGSIVGIFASLGLVLLLPTVAIALVAAAVGWFAKPILPTTKAIDGKLPTQQSNKQTAPHSPAPAVHPDLDANSPEAENPLLA